MKFKINCSPYLKMHQITKKLFNRNYLSDIRFYVGDKIIYGHSFELMKRSVVFEQQLENTLGEKKIILITDCSYYSFLEFIRFIYTDECKINNDNGIELLKLAVKYKIIALENRVINLLKSTEWFVQLFEHCVIGKYEIARNDSDAIFADNFKNFLHSKKFVSLHQDALNVALQFDKIGKGLTEVEIFNALVGWIDNYCKQNQISLTEGRGRFDHLIRKIRFPTMTNDEIRECVKKYPGLLNDSDYMSITLQVLFGSESVNNLWIAQPRNDYKSPYELRRRINYSPVVPTPTRDSPFITTFSVSKDSILSGVWIGVEQNRKELEIEIKAQDIKTLRSKNTVFTQSAPEYWNRMLISLGDSLVLKPNFEYTIAVKYLHSNSFDYLDVLCRKRITNVMLKDPENSIQTIKASNNILGLIFKSPPK